MKEQSILNIIFFGLEGNAVAVSAYVDALKAELMESGDKEFKAKIELIQTQPRTISPFMNGWWNCLESVIESNTGTFGISRKEYRFYFNTLKKAGITAEEAQEWLNTDNAERSKNTAKVVKQYLESIKEKK